MKIWRGQTATRLLLCMLAFCHSVSITADEEDYSVYQETESLYQSARETDDCAQIDRARVVLLGLSRSREPIPPALAEELRTGRAWLGDYARAARRDLNKRWAELCREPVPDCKPAPPVEREALDATYAMAGLTTDCRVAVHIAERLIGMSDASSASYTLVLLLRLQRERPECFP